MNLDESQRQRVAAWVAEGMKLSEIQSRLASELGLRLTYMEVRFLVDDLKLTPKDAELPKPVESPLASPQKESGAQAGAKAAAQPPKQQEPATPTGNLSLSVDQITRPGAVVSGKVTFSDGNKADWYIDELGRLGLVPQQTGYRPPAADLQQFQRTLEGELSKLGL